ncbi:hypothetical protein BDV96DRAFT_653112 [Lophiotrema nucula]|uniref:F-box domain-containing protein n=1 Tax=Lophiotrema nucula TaxID=690887 RepID=A0A6A5YMN0_9PLEO|nr:hypothetical protein BDV96DRAFT_653112 [Lophiotrema nucula]
MEHFRWGNLWRMDFWTQGNSDTREEDVELYESYNDTEGSIPLPPLGSNDACSLSNDIWLMIIDRLPQGVLARTMFMLSWRFHCLCSRVLYQNIDVSLHHYKIPNGNSSADYSWIHWDCSLIARRHRAIADALVATPRYASYVRSLTWTMGFDRLTASLPRANRADVVASARSQVEIFPLMENVTTVDLDTGFMRVPPLTPPSSLFPGQQKFVLVVLCRID